MSYSRAAHFEIALVSLIALAGPITGRAASLPYAQMAPLSQYLSADRQAEIDLARSAAPPAISLHATVLVFTPQGYATAEHGTNGFTCVVERSWNDPFDDAEFWNWKMRAPVCYNAPASRTVLQYTIFRTKMALGGVSKSQMLDRLRSAIANGELPPAEGGSMAYMMSKEQYLNDDAKSWYPHVMFYAPRADAANDGESWGADRRGSPVVFDSSHHVNPEPFTVFFVPVAHWSDGSLGPGT
ncbi:MAG TPA: hypothetical protein VMT95_08405 [Candidatus Binatia bacterium]|nr:hypothetical protein [Candidatus Binatia bacterium]